MAVPLAPRPADAPPWNVAPETGDGLLPPISPIPFDASDGRHQSRLGVLALVVAAVAALAGGGVAVALALDARQHDVAAPTASEPAGTGSASSPTPESSTGPAAGAPTGLRLVDNGTSIVLTWQDPPVGQAQFVVAGGQGTDVRALRTTRETSFTLNGLNPRLDYCFTVAAVYDADRIAVSDLACTSRSASAAPGTPPT